MRAVRRPMPIVLLVVLLAIVGCAGCGGGSGVSKQQYAQELRRTGQALSATLGQIEQQTGASTSLRQTGVRLGRGADAIDKTADRFAAITPPADARAAHRKLIDALHEMASVLRRASAAARANDRTKMTTILQGLVDGDAARKLGEAEKELQDRGITATTTAGGG
jgi:hypothetical protein